MPRKSAYGPMNQASEERPQCPEDARAPGYDNNHKMDWLRGVREDATRMPHFDKSPKYYPSKKGR
jgi:hypothetical protein